jgi:prepilin-type N-terminal cleavage/methylation domain-containing protein
MTRTRASGQGGFSLLETLIAMSIFLAILTAALSVYSPSRFLFVRGEMRVDAQQNARVALVEMQRQIRLAGYFPENFVEPAPSPVLANPVLLATNSAFAVHGDIGGTGASTAVFFCLDGTVLRRSTGARTSSAAYTCTSGDVLAENVTSLRFTYYDANGAPVPNPPATPYQLDGQAASGTVPGFTTTAERDSIRRIVITITSTFTAPQRPTESYSVSSDVWLRNI